ncbi:MAG: Rne/Rng family ribonuclease [Candidatus Omnitrophica bacterium]|nr:Rne/Rng family ribonuclease [Candidatus Omnitrophota bacterium]MBU4488010.1 Rne/Rng family ribonuclease [Candidatus Omnitrophota bacterium]MCG2704748.1 Rne/Rng family ribonuclease [Candidatus Omnitrophota bacterium]
MKKEIIVNATPEESRVAILNNGRIEEYYVERTSAQRLVSSVYKGKVESIMAGIGAAFVNIGLEKNGFLYVDDIIEEGAANIDILEDELDADHKKRDANLPRPKITDILKKGQEVLVQVVKEPLGTKGARLTAHVTLPGRYIVLMAHDTHKGISKKISDAKERKRLKAIIDEINLPKNIGVIVRTAAIGHTREELRREASYLYNLYRRIEKIASRKSAPALVNEEYGLVQRVARDNLAEDVSFMIIDSKVEYQKTLALLRMMSPKLRTKLKLHTAPQSIFEKFNIAGEIEKIFDARVNLPSKGYIIIQPTEGLVAIDVNSGGFSSRNPEETSYITNKEAAIEIARQLKLRDMGGIIVIDFIDMEVRDHRQSAMQIFLNALKNDKAKTKVLNFSSIGLVEMTRQRVRKSLEGASHNTCPYCGGRGTVKSLATMSIELLGLLEKKLKTERYKKVQVAINADLKEYLLQNYKKAINNVGRNARCNIILNADSHLHVEDVRVSIG